MDSLSVGERGEDLAASFLKGQGYRIIDRNYKTRMGEIDLVARDKDTLCFIEVKTRSSTVFSLPQESVTIYKQRRIAKAALMYLKQNNLLEEKARFDVVSVVCANQDAAASIELIKNAFELSDI